MVREGGEVRGEDVADIARSDVAELAQGIEANAKGFGMVIARQAQEALDKAKDEANKAHVRE